MGEGVGSVRYYHVHFVCIYANKGHYDLGVVLNVSGRFPKKVWIEGWVGEVSCIHFLWVYFNFAKPLRNYHSASGMHPPPLVRRRHSLTGCVSNGLAVSGVATHLNVLRVCDQQ